jgi:hypothetical protein
LSVCGYPADVDCLGIKNVLSPDITDELGPEAIPARLLRRLSIRWQDAPIELTQHIVFGAWERPPAITFGKEDKPFYISITS